MNQFSMKTLKTRSENPKGGLSPCGRCSEGTKIENLKLKIHRMCGQVILISIIMLSGVLMSASVVAGLLTAYQIRQANDTVESMKAFFAADAGIEQALYNYFNEPPILPSAIVQNQEYYGAKGTIAGSTNYSSSLTFRFDSPNPVVGQLPIGFTVRSYGDSGKVQRALETRVTTKF